MSAILTCFIIQLLINHISGTDGIALLIPSLPNTVFSASSNWDNTCEASDCRFSGTGWCSKTTNNGEWLQVDLGDEYVIESVSTKGFKDSGEWTETYTIDYKRSIEQWVDYPDVLSGNTDENTEVNNPLSGYIVAQYIRFYPETSNNYPDMRIEIYGYLYTESPTNAPTIPPTNNPTLAP
eukprot:245892_1